MLDIGKLIKEVLGVLDRPLAGAPPAERLGGVLRRVAEATDAVGWTVAFAPLGREPESLVVGGRPGNVTAMARHGAWLDGRDLLALRMASAGTGAGCLVVDRADAHLSGLLRECMMRTSLDTLLVHTISSSSGSWIAEVGGDARTRDLRQVEPVLRAARARGAARPARHARRGARLPRRRLTPPAQPGCGTSRRTPVCDVVDEAAHAVAVRDERAVPDARDRLQDVEVEVLEGLGVPRDGDAGLGLELGAELAVVERLHAAVGVVDEDDLLGPHQPLGDRERADLTVGDDAAGVADDVRVALAQAEQREEVDPRVHARHDGEPALRRALEAPAVEARGVRLGVADQVVVARHGRAQRLV